MPSTTRLSDARPTADGAPVPPIQVEDLVHQYPTSPRPALDHVSFTVAPGEIFGILGPNGSGKTTLFGILSTLLSPTAGNVRVMGFDAQRQPDRVRQALGVVFQMPSLDGQLTARENLWHQGHLHGLRGRPLAQRMDQLLAHFGLTDRQHELTRRFSGGMRRRVELAKALLHQPQLLLLDEPSTGLDPGARIDLWQALQALRTSGVTIALTTHLMDEADRCDRLAILTQGRLAALDAPAHLKARIGGDVITLEVETGVSPQDLAQQIAQRFGPWPADTAPSVLDGRVYLEKPNGPAFVATVAAAFAGQIRSIAVGKPTLEDVFLHLTSRRLWEEEPPPPASARPRNSASV